MNILTIYTEPDPQDPSQCFDSFIKALRKFPVDDGHTLYIVMPRCTPSFKQSIIDKITEEDSVDVKIIEAGYVSSQKEETWDQFHSRVLGSSVIYLPNEGDVLYIPIGWVPTISMWADEADEARRLHDDKFLGQMARHPDRPEINYFNGPVITRFEHFKKTSQFKLVLSKEDPFFRLASSMRNFSKSLDLGFRQTFQRDGRNPAKLPSVAVESVKVEAETPKVEPTHAKEVEKEVIEPKKAEKKAAKKTAKKKSAKKKTAKRKTVAEIKKSESDGRSAIEKVKDEQVTQSKAQASASFERDIIK